MSEKKLYCWRVMQESPKIEAWGEATEQDLRELGWVKADKIQGIIDELKDAEANDCTTFKEKAGMLGFYAEELEEIIGSGKQEERVVKG